MNGAIVIALGVVCPESTAGTSGSAASTGSTFRRLDGLTRLACIAVQAAGVPIDESIRNQTAIVFGTTYGSIATDRRFVHGLDSRLPEPAVFPYTLPSACVGEVARRHGLHGPSICISEESLVNLDALDEAERILACGDAPAALVLRGEFNPPESSVMVALLLVRPDYHESHRAGVAADWFSLSQFKNTPDRHSYVLTCLRKRFPRGNPDLRP